MNAILIILIVIWFFGLLTSYTMGGFIHFLLVMVKKGVKARKIKMEKEAIYCE